MESESISSSIDDCDSTLATVPCTTITEIQRPPPTAAYSLGAPLLNNRFKHDILGWSPDIFGNFHKFASGDHGQQQHYYSKQQQPQLQETPKTTKTTTTKTTTTTTAMTPKAKDSSLYMMNYEQKLPAKIRQRPKAVMQKIEPPPSGYAVPVKANISPSSPAAASDSDGPSKVFSSPLPVYQLKANPMHRGTFYKCAFQSIQKLDSNEIQRAIWTTPNVSPRISVLHLSCNSGAVTAVNLATGMAIQKTLSSISVSASVSQSVMSCVSRPSLAEESHRMMELRSKWSTSEAPPPSSSSLIPTSQPSDYGNEYNEAWDEVNKEIDNLQKMFGGNNNNVSKNSYRTDEELEYQRQLLQDYAPLLSTTPTTFTTEDSYEDSEGEEDESEMQFMQASEPSEFEKNVKFRHSFEKVFKGRYDANIDRWLKMMTDETIVKGPIINYHQQHRQQQHQYASGSDDTIQEVDDDEDDDTLVEEGKRIEDKTVKEEKKQVLQILSTCESVLKQLETVTAAPKKRKLKKFGFQRNLANINNKFKYDCESTTPRAASSTIGYEESFDIIPY